MITKSIYRGCYFLLQSYCTATLAVHDTGCQSPTCRGNGIQSVRIHRFQTHMAVPAGLALPFITRMEYVSMSDGYWTWRNKDLPEAPFLWQNDLHSLIDKHKVLRPRTHSEDSASGASDHCKEFWEPVSWCLNLLCSIEIWLRTLGASSVHRLWAQRASAIPTHVVRKKSAAIQFIGPNGLSVTSPHSFLIAYLVPR